MNKQKLAYKKLGNVSLFDALFDKFNQHLRDNNLIMNEGIIIDGSFVEVPRQRNSREENKLIKEGKGDELWNAEGGTRRMTKNTRPTRSATRTQTRDGRRRAVRSSMATRHMPR